MLVNKLKMKNIIPCTPWPLAYFPLLFSPPTCIVLCPGGRGARCEVVVALFHCGG